MTKDEMVAIAKERSIALIASRYKKVEGFLGGAGGARVVRAADGRIAGHITRSYKAMTGTVTGWRFHPMSWTGLENRFFTAALQERNMLRKVRAALASLQLIDGPTE